MFSFLKCTFQTTNTKRRLWICKHMVYALSNPAYANFVCIYIIHGQQTIIPAASQHIAFSLREPPALKGLSTQSHMIATSPRWAYGMYVFFDAEYDIETINSIRILQPHEPLPPQRALLWMGSRVVFVWINSSYTNPLASEKQKAGSRISGIKAKRKLLVFARAMGDPLMGGTIPSGGVR